MARGKRNTEKKDYFKCCMNLRLEPYQVDILNMMAKNLCDLGNQMIRFTKHQWYIVANSKECKNLVDLYFNEETTKDDKDKIVYEIIKLFLDYRIHIKTTGKARTRKEKTTDGYNDFTFTNFGLTYLFTKFNNKSKKWRNVGLNAHLVQATICVRIAKAIETNLKFNVFKKHLDKNKKVILKIDYMNPKDFTIDFGSVLSANHKLVGINTDILWDEEKTKKRTGNTEHLENLKKKYGRNILLMTYNGKQIPLCFEPRGNDEYNRKGMELVQTPYKIVGCCIKSNPRMTKDIWEIQFTLLGTPPENPKNTKRIKKEGVVGLDLGTSTIAASNKSGKVYHNRLGTANGDKYRTRIKKYQTQLDEITRRDNPDNFKEDGTPKNRKDIKGWVRSDEYKCINQKVRALYRKLHIMTENHNNQVANDIACMGDTGIVEDMNFSSYQKRSSQTKKNKNGRYQSKKRYGTSILQHSPGAFITSLGRKMKIIKVNPSGPCASQVNPLTGECTKHGLNERFIDINGEMVQRDHIAANNLLHWVVDTYDDHGRGKTGHYENLSEGYDEFVKGSNKAMEDLVVNMDNGVKYPSCMGIKKFKKFLENKK